MAKILVSCGIADGHVNPFLPVVSHLVKSDHKIIWMCGRMYREKIEATGAFFHPFPLEFDPNGKDLYDFYPELRKLKGIEQIKFYIKNICYNPVIPCLEEIDLIRKKFEPDIYISDPIIYAFYFKAEQLKKPSINLHVIPLPISSKDHGPFGTGLAPSTNLLDRLRIRSMNFIVDKIVFRSLKKHSDTVRKSLGLPPYDHLLNGVLKNASKVLTVTVPGFDYPRSDMPKNIEYIGPIIPTALNDYDEPEWWPELLGDRPVVLVNQGTIANDIRELILPTISALGNENYFVVAVPVKDEIKNLPSNVKVAEFIPFANLLPHVDIMVTNGGFGATHMALFHGIPLVVSGGSEDKMEVSARVQYSGCGIDLKKLSPSPAKIRQAVDKVLKERKYIKEAQRLQKEISKYRPLKLVEQAITDLV